MPIYYSRLAGHGCHVSPVVSNRSVVCVAQINGQNMVNKSQNDALILLRNTQPGGTVRLVVSRQALKQTAPDNAVLLVETCLLVNV